MTPPDYLMAKIDSVQAEEAWGNFLSEYSGHIYQVVRRLETDTDDVADCFQFVCEQLIENRGRRLRKFKGEGAATFLTWLRAVVRNLCIDWHRRKYGRRRQFRAVSRLSVFDQEVFRNLYERAISPDECLAALAPQFPHTTAKRIEESRARIEELLTPNQRWLLQQRIHSGNGNELASLDQPESFLSDLVDAQPDPETQVITNERRKGLERALASLLANERLLIRLRFEEGLTLQKTAEVLGLGNPQRVDRQIQDILRRLHKALS